MRQFPTRVRLAALLAIVCGHCGCQTSSIAESHIQANVPDEGDFDRLMTRDLKFYLDRHSQMNLRVEYELLRQGPTQTGIAYPKYYAWVKGFDGSRVVLEGAARIAAIEKTRFEITDFLSRQEIDTSPSKVEKTFPAALQANIINRATE